MSAASLDHDAVVFLIERLLDKAGDRGMSSDAMIALALAGRGGVPENYDGPVPYDCGDLDRCYQAFHHAPRSLRAGMLPVLAQWTRDIAEKVAKEAGLNG